MNPTINRITHDPEANAAYISLVETDEGERVTTLSIENSSINLDFNEDHELVAIETLDASSDFPDELLDKSCELDGNTESISEVE